METDRGSTNSTTPTPTAATDLSSLKSLHSNSPWSIPVLVVIGVLVLLFFLLSGNSSHSAPLGYADKPKGARPVVVEQDVPPTDNKRRSSSFVDDHQQPRQPRQQEFRRSFFNPRVDLGPTTPLSSTGRPDHWDLTAQEIVTGLFLGPAAAAADKDWLRRAGITHILNIGAASNPLFSTDPELMRNIRCAYIDLDDVPTSPLIDYFPKAHEFVDEALRPQKPGANPGNILVHCHAGISRSTTVVASYLMQRFGLTAPRALEYIRKRRSIINPNSGFLSQLALFEEQLRSRAHSQ